MKLIPPPLEIDKDNPFRNDLFGREELAKSLSNLISRLDDSLVISVTASWGEGKTTFVKMWQGLLQQKGIKCIYFDAFANDYLDDPFIAITSEISTLVEKEFDASQSMRSRLDDFKRKASKAGAKLLAWGTKIGIKAATLGLIDDIEVLKEMKETLSDDASEFASTLIEKKLNMHKEDIEIINSFKSELRALAEDIRTETGAPLMFIIDELDRCKPTYALELIEKIKHFFSVKNVVFILVMHKDQLECAIKCVYGQEIEASVYLQKFINIECNLPKNRDARTSDYRKYCDYLYSVHGLNTWGDKENIQDSMSEFSRLLNLSLRDIERCYTYLTLFYSSVSKNTLKIPPIIALLVIAKVKFSKIYEGLKTKNITFSELSSSDFLKPIINQKDKSIIDWLIDILQVCLSTEEEYKNLDEEKRKMHAHSMWNYRVKRDEVIPFFCNRLDSFNIVS